MPHAGGDPAGQPKRAAPRLETVSPLTWPTTEPRVAIITVPRAIISCIRSATRSLRRSRAVSAPSTCARPIVSAPFAGAVIGLAQDVPEPAERQRQLLAVPRLARGGLDQRRDAVGGDRPQAFAADERGNLPGEELDTLAARSMSGPNSALTVKSCANSGS
jgi:hypothetical protein